MSLTQKFQNFYIEDEVEENARFIIKKRKRYFVTSILDRVFTIKLKNCYLWITY